MLALYGHAVIIPVHAALLALGAAGKPVAGINLHAGLGSRHAEGTAAGSRLKQRGILELAGSVAVYEPAGGIVMPEAEPVYVYLRQKDGEIIAAALLQDDGSYRFEQVPEGTYEVIPNIDGYDVNIQTVTISAGQTTAAIDDYILFDNDRDLITSVTAPRTDTATSSSRE